jgi:hypothetical protein
MDTMMPTQAALKQHRSHGISDADFHAKKSSTRSAKTPSSKHRECHHATTQNFELL